MLPVQCGAMQKSPYIWRQLTDGMQYAIYSFEPSEGERTTVHAFRLDPAKFSFDVTIAPNEKEGSTARDFAKANDALIAVNGGFFTPEHLSIGLIISRGKTERPLHNTSWWSVFYIAGEKPAIASPRDFKNSGNISTALQVGPRLTIKGKIPKLKEGISTRSAVGIDRQGRVIIAITSGNGISLKELANRMGGMMHHGGFDCPDSMALDGGASSQLYAKVGDFELALDGVARVTNGLVVLKK